MGRWAMSIQLHRWSLTKWFFWLFPSSRVPLFQIGGGGTARPNIEIGLTPKLGLNVNLNMRWRQALLALQNLAPHTQEGRGREGGGRGCRAFGLRLGWVCMPHQNSRHQEPSPQGASAHTTALQAPVQQVRIGGCRPLLSLSETHIQS